MDVPTPMGGPNTRAEAISFLTAAASRMDIDFPNHSVGQCGNPYPLWANLPHHSLTVMSGSQASASQLRTCRTEFIFRKAHSGAN